jgi:hypothetical protein
MITIDTVRIIHSILKFLKVGNGLKLVATVDTVHANYTIYFEVFFKVSRNRGEMDLIIDLKLK